MAERGLSSERRAAFESRIDRSSGPDACWPWMRGCNAGGYGQFSVNGRDQGAHRIAYELENGPVLDDLCVLHRCDNPSCCNPRHLFVGTRADNNRDREAKGRSYRPVCPLEKLSRGDQHYARRTPGKLARGEKHGRTPLTAKDVCAIRKRAAAGETQAALAREYNVSANAVNKIVRRKSWSHI